MVVLNKIYTKTGDSGQTSLGNGARVAKFDLRVESYGTVDELNATLGVAKLHAAGPLRESLDRIQNELFDLGADLCRPIEEGEENAEYPPLRLTQAAIDHLEEAMDAMTREIAPLTSFILPGGTALAAHLHICRTVARRAERLVVHLGEHEELGPIVAKYLNRLSDWFFVAARVANDHGKNDVLWVPGAHR